MLTRYEQARDATRGYLCSGLLLVGFDGRRWAPVPRAEEPAFAYFIPILVRFGHVGLIGAINLFQALMLVSGFSSGVIATFKWLGKPLARTAAAAGLVFILIVTALVGDIYMADSLIVLGVVPWALYFWRKRRITAGSLVFALMAGAAVAVANLTRMHAGTPVLLFVSILMLSLSDRWHKRLLFAALLIGGFLLPGAYHDSLISRRDAVLEKSMPGYRPIVPHHPFWHTVYTWLGFLNNDYGLTPKDRSVADKVRSIDPNVQYVSHEYERILRDQVLRFARSHPLFVFETFAAKSGMLFIILLVCGNIGLLSLLFYPKHWALELAFWVALVATGVRGLLASPNPVFLLGYIAFAVFYSIAGVDLALANRVVRVRGYRLADQSAPLNNAPCHIVAAPLLDRSDPEL